MVRGSLKRLDAGGDETALIEEKDHLSKSSDLSIKKTKIKMKKNE